MADSNDLPNWALDSSEHSFGWRWCGAVTLDDCKAGCIAAGNCAEVYYTHGGCCYPSKAVCSGSVNPQTDGDTGNI
jgi:hypothetical protein